MKLRDFFSVSGKLKRFEYFAAGFLLVAVKYNIDRAIEYYGFGDVMYPTDYFTYFSDPDFYLSQTKLMYTLVLTSIPFIIIGTLLTIKRLRDAGLPKWMVIFFFLPFLNLIFFSLLCFLPSSDNNKVQRIDGKERWLEKVIPGSDLGSAVASALITSVLSVLAMSFCIFVLRGYGSSLFLGIPFVQGMLAAIIGAVAGYAIQKRKINTSLSILLLFGTIPLLSGAEYSSTKKPSLRKVTSEIIINSPREKVWEQLVTFNEMREPDELLFKSGIAYPIRAEIEGTGVGSVRKCWFTTGAFIEPIQIWDKPNLLQFTVAKVPPPLVELSIYNNLHLPHLEGYFTSEKGQFKLISITPYKTQLRGTTWYRHKIWPAFYWRIWSDYILHKIHYRVLSHIKNQTERI